jgi:hypothetical protein
MKLEESNKELLTELNKREEYWSNTIIKLSKKLKCPAKEVVQLQSDSLNERQRLLDEIKYMSYEVHQYKPILKNKKKEKLEFYLTSYQIKLQGPDRLKMIESDISLYEQRLDIYDTHIDFLRESIDTITQIGYGIKNKVVLYQLTELE